MTHEVDFIQVKNGYLRAIVKGGVTPLDRIISDHSLLAIDAIPGLFIIAKIGTPPQELAVQLAIRHFENSAAACFVAGFQAQAERAQFGGRLQ